ncbi:MAG: hypothetical protein ABSF98_08645 [Bryobacteraceae bacterium]
MLAIVRRNVVASDPEAGAWREILGRVIADLDGLNHESEQDFLRIGGKLAELIAAVDLISSELAVLANLVSGEHGLRASDALQCALNRSQKLRAHAEEGNGLLGGMSQDAVRLKRTLSGFGGTVSTLRTLGVLTRIETARLGTAGADFGNLAEDVKSLAGNVQARIASALDAAALLIPPIESAMQDISALEEEQVRDLPSVISGLLASLSSFRDMQAMVRDSSVRLGSGHDAISGAFRRLIVSLQFHDITRQQVEHVIEALRRLRSESAGEKGALSRDQPDTAAVLALQSRQLADAGAKFAASAASVAHNLDEIALHVAEMADESRTLSGLSESKKNSFFLEMEQACTVILDSLSHFADADIATRTTSGDLSRTVGRMHESIGAIQAIEVQVQRMALNASIRAAHIGPSGDALGVLAGSMLSLASECNERSESLVDALDAVSRAATRLSGHDGPARPTQRGGIAGALEEMRTAVADLHSSSERSFVQIAQIVARGARLREDLCATRDGFSVGALFAEAIARARDMLRRIPEDRQCDFGGAEALERGLAGFSRHYTMQAERDVHECVTSAAVGAAPVAVLAEQPESPLEGSGELGETVEFF